MAKPARGLPLDFSLDLPDEKPVLIGDFLDEAPAPIPVRKTTQPSNVRPTVESQQPERAFRPEIVPDGHEERPASAKPVQRASKAVNVIRCQLNLTPKSKTMLEDVVGFVQRYSPESDARTSEVFQAIIGLLHGAMEELELAELPRRGAWGSVTAKNFPSALSEAFEAAILRTAGKR